MTVNETYCRIQWVGSPTTKGIVQKADLDHLIHMAMIGEAEVARMAAPAAPKDLYLPEYRTSPIR